MPSGAGRSSGRGLTKVVVGIASAVLLIVVLAVLVPPIASSLLTRDVPVDLPSGTGTLSLRDVAVRWGGPQRIGRATLTDAGGARLADLTLEARSSLLDLALGGWNLGTIAVSGEISVSEDQLGRPVGAGAPPAAQPRSAKPATVPPSLHAEIDAGPMRITYTPSAGSGLDPVRIDGLRARATILGTGRATLTVSAVSPTIDVSAELRNFVDRGGRPAPSSAEGDLTVRVEAPGELVEALARLAIGSAEGGKATVSGGTAPTDIDASVKIEKGRLRLADPSKPATVKGPVPAAVVALLAAEGVGVEITNSPSVATTISVLDVPLPDAGGAMNLRGAALHARVETTPVEGRIALADAAARTFRVEPVEFEASAPDLAKGFKAHARTRGMLDGREAGALEVDLSVHDLLDGTGALRGGLPRSLRGSVKLTGVPTGLAQAMADRLGMKVEEIVGPTIDARITAETAEAPAESASVPAVRLRGELTASRLRAAVNASIDDQALVMPGDGLTLQLDRVGAAARAFLKDSGVELGEEGRLTLKAREVRAPMIGGGLPDLGRLTGEVDATLAGIVIEKGAGDRPMTTRSATARLALAGENAPPRILIDGDVDFGGEAMTLKGDVELAGLITRRDRDWPFIDVTPAKITPKGRVAVQRLPASLIAAFSPDNAALIRDITGPTVDLALVMPATSGGAPMGPRSVSATLRGANLSASASAAMDETSIRLGQSEATLTVTPSLVASALARFAPEMETNPALARPTAIAATVFSTSVNLDANGRPDLRTLRPVRVMASSADDVVLTNVPAGEGKAVSVGLRGLVVGGTYDRQEPLRGEGSIKAEVFDPAEPDAAVMKFAAMGTPMYPPPAFDVKVEEIDTARLDRMLGRPGLASDLLGDSAGVGLEGSVKGGVQDVVFTLLSPRLATRAALRRTGEKIELRAPASVELAAPAAWANRYLTPAAEEGRPPAVQFTDTVKVAMQLNRLALSWGGEASLGVLALDAQATSPSIKVRTAEGQAVEFQGLAASVRDDRQARGVAFDASTKAVMLGGAGSTQPVKAVGTVRDVFDEHGRASTERASITAEVNGTLPTAVIDALADQKGVLLDLLGPMTRIDLKASNFSRRGGSLAVGVNTDNARAAIKGTGSGGLFTAEGPANVALTRITPQLSARFIETSIPLLARVEKTPSDDPAVIDAVNLTLPLDGDTRKLNGDFVVDPGTVQFETASFFGKLVRFTGNLAGGRMGERIKPFQITAREGVLSYEKIDIPLGEFVASTKGSVNLNTKRMDVLAYVPFHALVKEVAAPLAAVPGIGRLTQIPIRIHGPLDNPKTELKPELILTENLGEAVKEALPDQIKKSAEDLLKDLLKKKKE